MELIGREEQITRLESYIQSDMSGTLVVHGQTGHGKSFLINSWLNRQSASRQILSVNYDIVSDFEPAQYFLKQWIQRISVQLPDEVYNRWQVNLRERSKLPYDVNAWVKQVGNRYQVDGYLFILKLKSLLEGYEGKIILCLDQCERLSAEGIELLRLICEWKPERMFVLLGLRTQESGKVSIESDFGVQFFFKGNQYLEVNHISPFLKDSYNSLYGIQFSAEDFNFMRGAGKQQKAWINQKCSECSDILEVFAFLSYFPAGIPDEINPIFHKIEALLDREPLLNYLLESSYGLTRIGKISLIADLEEFHPQVFESMKTKCLELGNQFLSPHELLELQLRILGQPSEECLRKLLTEYESTRSLNLLLELCEAMSDINWDSQELYLRLAWNLKILDLLLNYEGTKASVLVQTLPCDYIGQWELLLEVLWQYGAENLWFDYLKQVETLDDFGSLVLQILLKRSIKEDLTALQIEGMFTVEKLMDLEILLSLLKFMEVNKKPNNWDQVLNLLPEMAHYAEARFELLNLPPNSEIKIFTSRGQHIRTLTHNGNIHDVTVSWNLKTKENIDKSLEHIDLAISSSLQNGNLNYLPQLLTLLSECYANLEDFDHQLFFYREAVIAQQFLSNGV